MVRCDDGADCNALCIYCAHELTQQEPAKDSNGFGWCTKHGKFVDHQDQCSDFHCFTALGAGKILRAHPPRESVKWDDYYNDEEAPENGDIG